MLFLPSASSGTHVPADFGALLKALHCMHNQWRLFQVIAYTHSFIHPLTALPATPMLAAAAAGGTGCVASREVTPAPLAAVETSAGGGAAAADGGVFDDQGLGTSSGTRNFEDTLVE